MERKAAHRSGRYKVGEGDEGRTGRAPLIYLLLLDVDPQRELDLAGGIGRAGTFAKSPAYPRSSGAL